MLGHCSWNVSCKGSVILRYCDGSLRMNWNMKLTHGCWHYKLVKAVILYRYSFGFFFLSLGFRMVQIPSRKSSNLLSFTEKETTITSETVKNFVCNSTWTRCVKSRSIHTQRKSSAVGQFSDPQKTYESWQEAMLRKPPGLVSEIYSNGDRWDMKEAPSTTGITSATDLLIPYSVCSLP